MAHWINEAAPCDAARKEVRPFIEDQLAPSYQERAAWISEDWETFKALQRGFADGVNAEPVVGDGKLSREKGNRLDVYLKLWEKRNAVNADVRRGRKREWLYDECFPRSRTISWHSFEKACENIGLLKRE